MAKNKSVLYQLSDLEFVNLFKQCHNYSEVLRAVGLSTNGSASRTVLFNRMKELSLTRDDLLKEKRKLISRRKSDTDVFQLGNRVVGRVLKRHYLSVRTDEYKCDICGISEWNNKKLTLHLDHINGNKIDNQFENLRLVCPNCDSQLDTYRGKNIKIRQKHMEYYCIKCGEQVSIGATYCKKCASRINGIKCRRFAIDREDLKKLIREKSFSSIGKMYGVSDNAIRKRCKMFNLPYKSNDIKNYSDEAWEKL